MKRNFSLKAFLQLCLFTISINLFSQTSYEINPQVLSKLDKRIMLDAVYQVDMKEVDYYPIVDTQIYTSSYQTLLDDLKRYEKDYKIHLSEKKEDSIIHLKKIEIRDYVSSYLSSKPKNKVLLDNAQKLVEEINLELSKTVKVYSHTEQQKIYIKNNSKYSSKKELNDYLNVLNRQISNYKPIQPWGNAANYIKTHKEIEDFPEDRKFKMVKAPSKEPYKKNAYIIGYLIDANNLNGSFIEISSKVYKTIKPNETFIQDELTEEYGYHVSNEISFSLIQDTNSKSYYAITPGVNNMMKNLQKFEKLRHHIENLGYQTQYTGLGDLIVRTKCCYVGNLEVLLDDFSNAKKWLTQIDENHTQLQNLITKSNGYITKLDKYIQLHKVQRNRMASSDISAWTKVTNEAMQIAQKLFSLRYESGGVPLTIEFIKELPYTEEFNYNLSYSRNVLGLL